MHAMLGFNPILESTNPTPERQPSGLKGWVRDKQIYTSNKTLTRVVCRIPFSNNNENKERVSAFGTVSFSHFTGGRRNWIAASPSDQVRNVALRASISVSDLGENARVELTVDDGRLRVCAFLDFRSSNSSVSWVTELQEVAGVGRCKLEGLGRG
jgi:hypothetical protein